MDVDSLIIYNLVFLSSLFFAYCAEYFISPNKVLYKNISLLIISLFCGLRFNVGNDYGGYVTIFETISNGFIDKSIELGFYYLNLFFSKLGEGYVYVLFLSSFFTVFLVGKALWEKNILTLGVFFFFTSELLLLINDQVRQGAAIAIFLYAIKFIEQRRFFMYLLYITSAALFFHYTSLILLLAYFVRFFDFKKWVWFFVVTLAFLLYKQGAFTGIVYFVLERVPYYDRYLTRGDQYIQPAELGSGLAVTLWYIMGLIIIFFKERISQVLYVKIFLVGLILYFVTLDFPLIGRIAAYMFYVKVFVFSFLIKSFRPRTSLIPYIFIITSLLFFQVEIAMNLGKHGGFPYQTIFNKGENRIERK